ncbi:MAG: ComF family protein [Patescibacteria group bacterium]|nr:ComF family protein [Patescibacteria group bacterium]
MLTRVKKIILDLLFPISCLGCGRDKIWLCGNCQSKIPVLEEFFCPVCSRPALRGQTHDQCRRGSSLDGIFIAGDWRNKLLRKIIHRFKYNFIQDLKTPLGKLLIEKLEQADNFFVPALSERYFEAIVPIPLFSRRELWRGFNQAELLGRAVGEFLLIPVLASAVKRIKNTKTQVGKNQKARAKNMLGAFVPGLEISAVKGKKILIVDDVVTTAETMAAVAKVLKSAGASEVWGLCLARG